MRRWIDVSEEEYNRRMEARNRRNADNGCGTIIGILFILMLLHSC
jgi:hypothetical protein